MSKLKNYIEFIANDLMKEVLIDYEEDLISFPWVMEDIHNHYNDAFTEFPFFKHTVVEMKPYIEYSDDEPSDMEYFDNYIVGKYGVTKGSEVNLVWRILKNKLIDLSPELTLDPNDM